MQDFHSMIGTILEGRYLLISIIGRGGMAIVFNAFDRRTGKTVAIKMLCENGHDKNELPSLRKQFADEAKAMSLLSNPHIVGFIDANLEKSPLYFVMEYVDGITLKEYMKRKKVLCQKEVIDFSCQILSALESIHAKGIVHCDIKPHNILITRNGKLLLTDFGISRIAGKEPDLPKDKAVGTVYYVSPEQAEGKVLDHRSDLYSLGIMMYEMSVGELPFNDDDIDKVAQMQSSAPAKRPRTINPKVTKGMEQIILKAIAKKPYMRFETANEMLEYLEILRRNPNSVFRLQEKKTAEGTLFSGIYHSMSAYSVLLGVCCAFLLTVLIAVPFIHFSVFKGVSSKDVTLTVPNLQKITYEQALEKIDERYYDIEVTYVYNSGEPEGTIVSQYPSPNEKHEINPSKEQCVITIGVSSDVRELEVIDVISMSPDEAAAALKKEGYSVIFKTAHSETVGKGLAIGTFPKAGETALGGSEITLYISLGSTAKEIEMPDFIGKTETQGAQLLKESGLKAGNVTYKPSNEPIGTILEQSVKKGDSVYEGTRIDFVLSGGRKYNN